MSSFDQSLPSVDVLYGRPQGLGFSYSSNEGRRLGYFDFTTARGVLTPLLYLHWTQSHKTSNRVSLRSIFVSKLFKHLKLLMWITAVEHRERLWIRHKFTTSCINLNSMIF